MRKHRKSLPSDGSARRPQRRSPSSWRWLGSGAIALLLLLSLLIFVPAWRLRLWVALGWPIAIDAVQQRAFLVGETVTVRGTVGDRVPLIGGQVIELEDASGRLWVVSADTTRSPGESATIRGDVQVEESPTAAFPATVYLVEHLPDATPPLLSP